MDVRHGSRQRHDPDDGQTIVGYLGIVALIIVVGLSLVGVSAATSLRARAQIAADAAALAGAEEIRRQLDRHFRMGSGVPGPLDHAAIVAAVEHFADVNGAQVSRIDLDGLTVTASVATAGESLAALPDGVGVDDQRATADATATVNWFYNQRLLVEAPRSTDADGDRCPLGDAELRQAAQQAGVEEDFAISGPAGRGSVLSRPGHHGCDGGQGLVAVKGLREEMRAALLAAERHMNPQWPARPEAGQEILLYNAFRSSAYQQRLCAGLPADAPCADPGRSMHQFGLAVDVRAGHAGIRAATAALRLPLCEPVDNDAGHFVYQYGGGCSDRQAGPVGGAEPYLFEVYLLR